VHTNYKCLIFVCIETNDDDSDVMMPKGRGDWQFIENQTTCLICGQPFKDPQSIPCLHKFCKKCIIEVNMNAVGVSYCPFCSEVFSQDQIVPVPINVSINQLVERIHVRNSVGPGFFDMKCDKCDEGHSAAMWCADCENSFCLICKKVHERWREFKSHNKVITTEEYLQSPTQVLQVSEISWAKDCVLHTKCLVDLWCKTCSVLMCNDCATEAHYNHDFDSINIVMNEVDEKVKLLYTSLSIVLNNVKNKTQRIKSYEKQVSNEIVSVCHKTYHQGQQSILSLLLEQEKMITLAQNQVMSCLNFCKTFVNSRQLLLYNIWMICRVDDVLVQTRLKLDDHVVKVSRLGYWIKLTIILKDVYGIPVSEQLKHIKVECNKENHLQNITEEEQPDGIYYIYYIPKRIETHLLSVFWKSHIIHVDNVEIPLNTAEEMKIINQYGPKNKHLQFPYVVATGPNDELIVNDDSTNQLIVFDSNFEYSHTIGDHKSFLNITGITVNKQGYIFVADQKLNCVLKFKLNGSFLCTFGMKGSNNGEFHHPHGLVYSSSHFLFVCDRHNHRIQVFQDEKFVYCFGQYGAERGMFNQPVDLALNNDENQLFIADRHNNRVQVFATQGQFLRVFGNFTNIPMKLQHPTGISFAHDKHILISSYATDAVLVFKEDGNFFLAIQGSYQGNQMFSTPCGVVVMKNRQIVIASHFKNRLIVY